MYLINYYHLFGYIYYDVNANNLLSVLQIYDANVSSIILTYFREFLDYVFNILRVIKSINSRLTNLCTYCALNEYIFMNICYDLNCLVFLYKHVSNLTRR